MTIAWTQPVETTEDPPRPVRVLATDGPCAKFPVIAVVGNAFHREFSLDGRQNEAVHVIPLTLRNVAPPKSEPVLREAWVWWNSHGRATVSLNKKWCVHQRTVERGVYAHVAVMSDGSPVPGEEPDIGAMSILQMEKQFLAEQRDHWKSKAKALNRDLDSRIAECGSAWDKCDEWRTKAEALQAEIDEWKSEWEIRRQYELMKPVVDAAVAWVLPELRGSYTGDTQRLIEAVRTYNQTPKKTAAEAVANVAKMMGPVKNCTTCKRGDSVCSAYEAKVCNSPIWSFWEAKSHD